MYQVTWFLSRCLGTKTSFSFENELRTLSWGICPMGPTEESYCNAYLSLMLAQPFDLIDCFANNYYIITDRFNSQTYQSWFRRLLNTTQLLLIGLDTAASREHLAPEGLEVETRWLRRVCITWNVWLLIIMY